MPRYTSSYAVQPMVRADTGLPRVRHIGAGWRLAILGNLAGLAFAPVVFSLTVISFPLLLDRPVGAGVALRTSLQAVAANPAAHGALGPDRGGDPGGGQHSSLRRAGSGGAGAGPCHLASLPRGGAALRPGTAEVTGA